MAPALVEHLAANPEMVHCCYPLHLFVIHIPLSLHLSAILRKIGCSLYGVAAQDDILTSVPMARDVKSKNSSVKIQWQTRFKISHPQLYVLRSETEARSNNYSQSVAFRVSFQVRNDQTFPLATETL